MSVTVSRRAASEVKRMIQDQDLPETTMLRVGVVGGGCSGYEYRMEFASETEEGDEVSEVNGVRVVVDRRSAEFLKGTEIDIGEGLNNRGFVFNNPLAVRTCGCGSSFSV